MSLAEVLLSPQLMAAFMAYAALSACEAVASARLYESLENESGLWLWRHVYAPMLRAATLLFFILVAYPTLYGLTEAPSVTSLLAAEEGRFGHILGIVFLLTLALPLLPVLGPIPALVLPVQGVVTAALLYHWLAQGLGAEHINYWPGARVALGIIALSLAAYWLAIHGARLIEQAGQKLFDVADLGELARESLVLVAQAPAVILYGMALGGQLPHP